MSAQRTLLDMVVREEAWLSRRRGRSLAPQLRCSRSSMRGR